MLRKNCHLIAQSTIVKSLRAAFAMEDIFEADLRACAEQYVREGGLNDDMIGSVRSQLSRDRLSVPAFP